MTSPVTLPQPTSRYVLHRSSLDCHPLGFHLFVTMAIFSCTLSDPLPLSSCAYLQVVEPAVTLDAVPRKGDGSALVNPAYVTEGISLFATTTTPADASCWRLKTVQVVSMSPAASSTPSFGVVSNSFVSSGSFWYPKTYTGSSASLLVAATWRCVDGQGNDISGVSPVTKTGPVEIQVTVLDHRC